MYKTRPREFKKFHDCLTENMPFKPWYFKLGHDKDPIKGEAWKALYAKMSPKKAYRWMKAGFNVGIAATNMDPLVIIDIDDVNKTPDSDMKSTLTVTSRKRFGKHYFYLTEDPRCKRNIPTDGAGEMRCDWQYVVAPGSFIPSTLGDDEIMNNIADDDVVNAGYYTVTKARPPAVITYDDIPQVFKDVSETEYVREKAIKQHSDGISELYNLTVDDIFNIPNKKTRFPSLFHNSKTGKNTSVDGNWIICWRHNVSHNHLTALAVMAGMTTCQEGGYGHKGSGIGTSVLDLKDPKTIYEIWMYAKEMKMIPDDDIIPGHSRRYKRFMVDPTDDG